MQRLLPISLTLTERCFPRPLGEEGWCITAPVIHGRLFYLLRFETLEPEMNALAARITAVNDIAEQLLKASPPGKDSIVNTQKQLNHRWGWGG